MVARTRPAQLLDERKENACDSASVDMAGKDAHQDQVMLLAILLCHAALLVDGAFLLVTTGVAEVARYARAGRKRAVIP